MVRILKDQVMQGNKHYIEAAGISTDDKPLGVITGSTFLEVDTGDVYAYNEDGGTGSEWAKICALGGSGS